MTAVMRWTWLKLHVVTDLSENIMVTISCIYGSATFSQLHYSLTPRTSINIDAQPLPANGLSRGELTDVVATYPKDPAGSSSSRIESVNDNHIEMHIQTIGLSFKICFKILRGTDLFFHTLITFFDILKSLSHRNI